MENKNKLINHILVKDLDKPEVIAERYFKNIPGFKNKVKYQLDEFGISSFVKGLLECNLINNLEIGELIEHLENLFLNDVKQINYYGKESFNLEVFQEQVDCEDSTTQEEVKYYLLDLDNLYKNVKSELEKKIYDSITETERAEIMNIFKESFLSKRLPTNFTAKKTLLLILYMKLSYSAESEKLKTIVNEDLLNNMIEGKNPDYKIYKDIFNISLFNPVKLNKWSKREYTRDLTETYEDLKHKLNLYLYKHENKSDKDKVSVLILLKLDENYKLGYRVTYDFIGKNKVITEDPTFNLYRDEYSETELKLYPEKIEAYRYSEIEKQIPMVLNGVSVIKEAIRNTSIFSCIENIK